jgi:hypothetical protein
MPSGIAILFTLIEQEFEETVDRLLLSTPRRREKETARVALLDRTAHVRALARESSEVGQILRDRPLLSQDDGTQHARQE